MSDRKHKRKLFLVSGSMTVFLTTLVLLLVLRPTQGWLTLLEDKWKVLQPRFFLDTLAHTQTEGNPERETKTLTYMIDAELDTQNHELKGHVAVTLPSGNYRDIPFYLYPSPDQPMRIVSVEWNQRPAHYRVDPNQLQVKLPVSYKGSPTLDIRFVTPIPRAGTRFGEFNGIWSLDYWYPIVAVQRDGKWIQKPVPKGFGDPFLMDLANYTVRLRYPKGFTWFASGPAVQEISYGSQMVTEWKIDSVRNFTLIGSPTFLKKQWKTADGVDISVASQTDNHLDQLVDVTKHAIDTYTKRYGAFAYPVLSVVQMPEGTVFAHEYPNLALFSRAIWSWGTGERWIAHEIAHAWWFSSVGTYKALDPWLDEGLADYSARLYLEDRYGKERYRAEIKQDWTLFVEQRGYSPRDLGRSIGPITKQTTQPYMSFSEEDSYYYLEYLRPVLMYHDLRMHMGDDKFFAFLKQFYLKNRLHTVSRADLEHALADVAPDEVQRLNLWLDSPNQELIAKVQGDFQ
ncbi:hypothetical protein DNHGIG_12950 [Collibacillus ludicampi]|uniref:Peptidase M1 membrane alanine aminopeptidase domain-containing protein n=1 Tax=Collibacillus ludicampi TaxID=2771369 RepID=A0AAV4LDE2_9BACL|nr:M1 family aminopeptidase [Collibacillus ludicampi]GIM45746.1 hypothetical protein DNHGIG_12950 [Collibacillus ludicampi]